MHRPRNNFQFLFFFFFLLVPLRARADVGTAAFYGPPYLPTACFGSDSSQFPPNNLFAAAGEGIWDNAASCGREYLVRCLSSAVPGACTDGILTIQVTVVDQADGLVNSSPSAVGTTLVLSRTAFAMIASLSSSEINIEFTEEKALKKYGSFEMPLPSQGTNNPSHGLRDRSSVLKLNLIFLPFSEASVAITSNGSENSPRSEDSMKNMEK